MRPALLCPLLPLLCCCLAAHAFPLGAADARKPRKESSEAGLRRLFDSLDANSDSQVDAAEAERYAAAAGFDWQAEGWTPGRAAAAGAAAIDGADSGGTISAVELHQYLNSLLQARPVCPLLLFAVGWRVLVGACRSRACERAAASAVRPVHHLPSCPRNVCSAPLHRLLDQQEHRVVDWVVHGLGLPQYALAFRRNAVTALDFPLLVDDGGATLRSDLGVTSRLHQHQVGGCACWSDAALLGVLCSACCLPLAARPVPHLSHSPPISSQSPPSQQIVRGLTRLILGLGELPLAARQLECSAANRTTVRISWQPPARMGHPAAHKFVLQRQRVPAGAGSCALAADPLSGRCLDGGEGSEAGSSIDGERWEHAGDPDDEDRIWWDAPSEAGTYRYRLAAWSAFGHGAYAVSAPCTVRAVARRPAAPPPTPLVAAAEVQALLAAVAAAGGSLSAEQAAAAVAASKAGTGQLSWSAASSAVVVGLTIILKASQLRVGNRLLAAWRVTATAWRGHRRRGSPADGEGEEEAAEWEEQAHSRHSSPFKQRGSPAVVPLAGGMRRVGSSHTSLAALDAAGAMGEELPHSVTRTQSSNALLRSLSSEQLLGLPSGEGSRLYGSGLTEGFEPAVSGLSALDDASAEQLALLIRQGVHCAHPGCHRRFDRLRDMRRKMESHYCSQCQHVVCLHHTRVSPHGPRGGCGLDSKCVCCDCFAELAPAQQAAYDRINRLPRATASGAAAAAGGLEQLGSGPVAPPAATTAAPAARSPPSSPPTSPPTEPVSAGEEARRRWRVAGFSLRALSRFQAGSRAAEGQQQQHPA